MSAPETTLQATFAPLRKASQALAREHLAAFALVRPALPYSTEGSTAAFAALLADLTRPASRDFWARWWLARNVPLPDYERRPRVEIADAFRGDAVGLRAALIAVGGAS